MKRREKRRRGEMKLGMNRREETRESQRQEDSLEAADSKRGFLARLTQGGNFGSFIRKREPETPRPAVRVERESWSPGVTRCGSKGSRAARSSGGVTRCGSKAQPDLSKRHSAQKFRSSDSQRKLFTKPPTTTH